MCKGKTVRSDGANYTANEYISCTFPCYIGLINPLFVRLKQTYIFYLFFYFIYKLKQYALNHLTKISYFIEVQV